MSQHHELSELMPRIDQLIGRVADELRSWPPNPRLEQIMKDLRTLKTDVYNAQSIPPGFQLGTILLQLQARLSGLEVRYSLGT